MLQLPLQLQLWEVERQPLEGPDPKSFAAQQGTASNPALCCTLPELPKPPGPYTTAPPQAWLHLMHKMRILPTVSCHRYHQHTTHPGKLSSPSAEQTCRYSHSHSQQLQPPKLCLSDLHYHPAI
jgi:hypothetical protein